jgi:hypothetical protein
VADEGWQGVLQLSQRVSHAWELGEAVAEVAADEQTDAALSLLAAPQPQAVNLGLGYVARRFRAEGWAWLEKQLAGGLSPKQQAWLLLVTRDFPRSWRRADELGPEVAETFWKHFSVYGLGPHYQHVEETGRRLLGALRPAAALHLLTMYALRRVDADPVLADVAADSLDALLELPTNDLPSLRPYDIQTAIGFLEKHRTRIGVDRLARIEWLVLPALGHDPKVPTLHDALAEDASLFVELLSVVYRRRSESDKPVSEEERARATNAYRLLPSWSRLPGTRADGSVDGCALSRWVQTALSLLDTADRRAVGEEHIGHVLASAPADRDGGWPCVEVRDLLEDVQLDQIEHGLRRQMYNSRPRHEEPRKVENVRSRSPSATANRPRTSTTAGLGQPLSSVPMQRASSTTRAASKPTPKSAGKALTCRPNALAMDAPA